jgi:hypothetical protein
MLIYKQNIFLLKKNFMKQLFIALIIMSSYFAEAHPLPGDIAPAAITSFKQSFKNASNSQWAVLGDLYRVKFNYNDQLLYAFYNEQGEQLCIGRTISPQQLPPVLQARLSSYSPEYEIVDAFEISNASDMNYYVTIVNHNNKIILKSSGILNWSVYSKTKISKKQATAFR